MWLAENRDTLGNIIIATPPCLAGWVAMKHENIVLF